MAKGLIVKDRNIHSQFAELNYGTKVWLLAFIGALITMFSFLVSNYFTLPPSDGARQMNVMCAIFDPFVLTVALPIAALGATAAFPLAYFCLKQRNVVNCSLFVNFISIVSIIILTINKYDVFMSIPRVLLILIPCFLICKFLPIPFFREQAIREKKNGND